MANTRKERETSESRGQVAKKLCQEARMIIAKVNIMEETEFVNMKQMVQWASLDLQEYIFEKFSKGIVEWRDIKMELESEYMKGL